jgi:hypothetical protein
MSYEEATRAKISLGEAFAELQRHCIIADHEGDELFDCTTGETIAMGKDGSFNGADILGWLGY